MPIIGSTITDFNQLKNYSADSKITTQKNFFNDKTSVVVLEGYLSRGLYAVRACFFSDRTKAENAAALQEVKKLIANHYGTQLDKNQFNNKDLILEKFSDLLTKASSSLLTVQSLKTSLKNAEYFIGNIKRAENINNFTTQKELAEPPYDHFFKREEGYIIPDQNQLEKYKALIGYAIKTYVSAEEMPNLIGGLKKLNQLNYYERLRSGVALDVGCDCFNSITDDTMGDFFKKVITFAQPSISSKDFPSKDSPYEFTRSTRPSQTLHQSDSAMTEEVLKDLDLFHDV